MDKRVYRVYCYCHDVLFHSIIFSERYRKRYLSTIDGHPYNCIPYFTSLRYKERI